MGEVELLVPQLLGISNMVHSSLVASSSPCFDVGFAILVEKSNEVILDLKEE